MAVSGHSMEPALREGDWLFMLPPRRTPRVGDVVLVPDPRDGRLLLKRVTRVDGERVVVTGDHGGHSTADSAAFGPVARSAIVARAAFRYAPLRRFGFVTSG